MAWQRVLGFTVIGSALAFGCTVTTSSDGGSDLRDGGSNGSSNGTSNGADGGTNGSTNGGTNGNGSGTSNGSSDGGSSGSTSGDGGAPDGSASGTGDAAMTLMLVIDAEHLECDDCVQEKCKSEWSECTSDECAGTCTTPECDGAGETKGELRCIHDCMLEQEADGGFAGDMLFDDCLGTCAQDDLGIGTDETLNLYACINDSGDAGAGVTNCRFECFGY